MKKRLVKTRIDQASNATEELLRAYSYDLGEGVKKNVAKAIFWYLKAAKKNSPLAYYNLGQIYSEQKQHVRAVKWWRKSAELGETKALCNLGVATEEGMGLKTDPKKAFHYYTKAAKMGNLIAQYNVGRCMAGGLGTEPNLKKAQEYFKKIIPKLKKLAEKNAYEKANETLGICYHNGWGVRKNHVKSFRYYKVSVEKNRSAWSIYCMGLCYLDGEGVLKNRKKAYSLLKKALSLGVKKADTIIQREFGCRSKGSRSKGSVVNN